MAESAAGGLIAAELSRLPGSSDYFRGGIVAYDDASKVQLLGIPEALFLEHGSVSAEAASAMAEAARQLFGATYGVGETGIAGPGGATPEKPVGLSYVAVAGPAGVHVRESRFAGDREANRQAAVREAVELLLTTDY
ncbi:MAG TPA: CinA family protein [Chloroflexota bacterium]